MSTESVSLVLDAAPALHRFGYSPSEMAVLLAIARLETSKGTSGKYELFAQDAPLRQLALDAGTQEQHVALTIKKALYDGMVRGVVDSLTRKHAFYAVNTEAMGCLLPWSADLRDASRAQTRRDARKATPLEVDFSSHLTPEAAPDGLRAWVDGVLLDLVRATMPAESVFRRDEAWVYMTSLPESEKFTLERGTVAQRTADGRDVLKPCVRAKLR